MGGSSSGPPAGPILIAYQGSYDDRTLGRWAERLTAWAEQGLRAFCYFDNDEAGYAAANAQRLAERLGQG